jgi:outer membrane lipopolysaccharide assembly protein LptE/RlpB
MNKYFNYIIIFFFICACSHQPIFSGKKVSFGIKNIEFDKTNKVEVKIDKILNNYKDLKNKNTIIDLEISSKINKTITSKDKNGDPESYKLELVVETIVKKDNELVSSTVFNKSHNYNNTSNKFDLKNFENSTINNFAEKIAEEIVIYLLSI